MTHTPGPWIVDRSMCGELEPFDAKNRHLLNSNGPLPLRQREANARLIAAAPELLDALKKLMSMINFEYPYGQEIITKAEKTTTTDHKITIQSLIDTLGLTMTAEFIPMKRPVSEVKHPKLHWSCTFKRGKQSMTVGYHQGIGYVQGYQQAYGKSPYIRQCQETAYRMTCEDGRLYKYDAALKYYRPIGKQPAPNIIDVLYCLIMDSDVLERGGFEEWASDYGYDTDSRKAEQTYKLCLEQSLKLKELIRQDELDQLRDAYQDY